jgi:AcrR family transcriptional regulator
VSRTRRRGRRTQAERRAETRGRIVDAAIASLEEHGYHGTSITAVCELAGVSRGAFSHHFPTKSELCAVAMEEALRRRATAIFEQAVQLAPGPGRDRRLLELLHDHHSRLFYAWLELATAARTDPVMRKQASRFAARYDAMFVEAFWRLAGRTETARLAWLPFLVLSLVDGLGFQGILHASRERPDRILDLVVRLIELAWSSEAK